MKYCTWNIYIYKRLALASFTYNQHTVPQFIHRPMIYIHITMYHCLFTHYCLNLEALRQQYNNLHIKVKQFG